MEKAITKELTKGAANGKESKRWYNVEIPNGSADEKERTEKFKEYLKKADIYYEASALPDDYLHFEIYTDVPAAVDDALDKIVWVGE